MKKKIILIIIVVIIVLFGGFVVIKTLKYSETKNIKNNNVSTNNNTNNTNINIANIDNEKVEDIPKTFNFSKSGLEVLYSETFKIENECILGNSVFNSILSLSNKESNKYICFDKVSNQDFSKMIVPQEGVKTTENKLKIENLEFSELWMDGKAESCFYYYKNVDNSYYVIRFFNEPNYMEGEKCLDQIDEDTLGSIKALRIQNKNNSVK